MDIYKTPDPQIVFGVMTGTKEKTFMEMKNSPESPSKFVPVKKYSHPTHIADKILAKCTLEHVYKPTGDLFYIKYYERA